MSCVVVRPYFVFIKVTKIRNYVELTIENVCFRYFFVFGITNAMISLMLSNRVAKMSPQLTAKLIPKHTIQFRLRNLSR